MKILGLDISAHMGWALVSDNDESMKLESFGYVETPPSTASGLIEDFLIVQRAKKISKAAIKIIKEHLPDFVLIEQTNQGSFRSSQKLLEFTHGFLLRDILDSPKNKLPIDASRVGYVDSSKWRSVLKINMTPDQKKHNKALRENKGKKKKLDGPWKGKITKKHLAVFWVNEKFGLNLKIKDNDIADAICLAAYGIETRKKQSVKEADGNVIYSWL
jgi:Holliday junction resolvasome RuvABC endonuclease subunit